MDIKRMRLSEFEKQIKLVEGTYNISYTDITHLPEGKFINIGEVKFDNIENEVPSKSTGVFFAPFSFKPIPSTELFGQFKETWKDSPEEKKDSPEKNAEREYPRRIYDEISQSLVRCKMIAPQIDQQRLNKLFENEKGRYFLISDTNAIKNGLLNWICHSFSNSYHWLGFLIISQIQFQEADEKGKKKSGDPKWSRYNDVLRKRTLATVGTWAEKELKEKFPVEFIDLPPELLRYYGGSKKEETTILEDRLIIEGIKRFFKERNISNVEKLIVTSDFRLTKFLELESISYIYGRIKELGEEEQVYSTKYNLFRKDFDFCTVHTFIWDLTHIFSTLKIENKETKERLILRYYPEKEERTPEDWNEGILFIEYFEGNKKEREEIKLLESYRDSSKNKVQHIGLSGVLDVIQSLEKIDKFTTDDIRKSLPKSSRYIRRGIYVLEGIGLIKRKKNNFVKTELFRLLLEKWVKGDIAFLHKIFLNFVPYKNFIDLLCEKDYLPSSITKETSKELIQEIEQLIGNIEDYLNLRNLGINLGEIYLSEDKIYCGTSEPSIANFAKKVENEFKERRAIDKQTAISDIVDSVCKKLHITPIKFESYINKSLREGFLENLEPYTAAGVGKRGAHLVLQSKGIAERFRKITIDASIKVAGKPTKTLVLREERV